MVKHGMTVQCIATHFLNKDKIPVTAFDARLYIVAQNRECDMQNLFTHHLPYHSEYGKLQFCKKLNLL